MDNAYDEMDGLYKPEEEGAEPQVQECSRCRELNEPDAAFCMRCGYALRGESAADFEADVESDVKQDYAETDSEETTTKAKLDTIDDLLDDPDVKTALLERSGAAEWSFNRGFAGSDSTHIPVRYSMAFWTCARCRAQVLHEIELQIVSDESLSPGRESLTPTPIANG